MLNGLPYSTSRELDYLLSTQSRGLYRLVRSLFQLARERRPSIIFIDEIDSMCGGKDRADKHLLLHVK